MGGSSQSKQDTIGGRSSRTVVIALDGSEHSRRAFDWYQHSIGSPSDKVILRHVLMPPPSLSGVPHMIPATYDKECNDVLVKRLRDRASQLEQEFLGRCRSSNLQCQWQSTIGDPGVELVNEVMQSHADLVIMGTRGLGTFRRTILGSVSSFVLHHVNVPVIIIPAPGAEGGVGVVKPAINVQSLPLQLSGNLKA